MKYNKLYEADDKMITLISDNYNILQSLGRFGISLGFGDKTVREVCEEQEVDTFTFLAIVNYTINGYRNVDSEERFSVPTLLHYLKSSHEYYLNFQLPAIRTQLQEALDMKDNLARLILKLYDGYAQEIRRHMQYEEKTVFPYVVDLLNNKINNNYDIDTFSKHHGQVDLRLKELKNIIIKYLPTDIRHNNQLTSILYNLYNNEEWLVNHSQVEEDIFIPAIRNLEHRTKQSGINANISRMINSQSATTEALSDREKDVVVSLVQGMSNKEIAEHLFISTNTVITHRRNIARKLQLHSAAGLTIYAIVNNLIDMSAVKL